MNIITPDKEFVKRKITDKNNPCLSVKTGRGKTRKKSMTNITPDEEFVKKKIKKEVGEKPGWLCVDDFHNQQPRGDSSTSFSFGVNLAAAQKKINAAATHSDIPGELGENLAAAKKRNAAATILTSRGESSVSVDINLVSDQKNATGGILTSMRGETAPLGSRKSGFLGGEMGGNSALLDTSEISPH
ncbi:unnamed protein product, partial [marine sediment metagenome]